MIDEKQKKITEVTLSVEEKKPKRAVSEIEIENTVLKAENASLKAKIEKLQKALAEQM